MGSISKSIVQRDKECWVCGSTGALHRHHIYPGLGRREMSEHFGLWVWLCPYHHNMSSHGVHSDKSLDLKLKRWGQRKFEETHTRAEWHRYFGRSYLEEEDE